MENKRTELFITKDVYESLGAYLSTRKSWSSKTLLTDVIRIHAEIAADKDKPVTFISIGLTYPASLNHGHSDYVTLFEELSLPEVILLVMGLCDHKVQKSVEEVKLGALASSGHFSSARELLDAFESKLRENNHLKEGE
ncbi:hypothetical protein LD13_gp033 [Bacillus phage Bobb]|uniref:Uncharacterized protein n=1 Tax=Bacillus phage Bobb TaxID=1527469 RepID=A0A076G7L5_9CAUD|nr:hypothetical protein LD13_gp033 [Bacillus phage Bobb]AII27934.1 hypothetical protein [Bacillus phage Bobb]